MICRTRKSPKFWSLLHREISSMESEAAKINPLRLYVVLGALLFTVFVMSLSVGRLPVPAGTVFKILLSPLTGGGDWTGIQESVILKIRLPRVLFALCGGLGLGVAGTVFQGVFRNPLVSPGVVGVTSGSGFGAALGILLFGWTRIPQLFAFLFGGGALLLTWVITKRVRASSLLVFVLAGVIVNLFFQAMISLVKFLADAEEKLPSIVYWLMGSLSSSSWRKVAFSVPFILSGTAVLILMRRRVNLLSLGEETVLSLGIDPNRIMGVVLVVTTLIVSAIVSVAGIVGWIGLIVPHIARMIVGADHTRLVPAAALIGAVFFIGIDTLGRSISPHDIPLGILTAVVGAPLFIILLLRSRGEWAL